EEFIGSADPVKTILTMVRIDIRAGSNIVFFVVRGKDPLKITKIANTWAEEFVKSDMEQRVITAKYGISWLGEQLDTTLKKLEEAEKKLNEFMKENRIVTMPDTGGQQASSAEDLQRQRSQLEKEIIEASRKYGSMHPKMEALQSQLNAVNQKLKDEQDSVFTLQSKNLEYKILSRDVDTYKSIYNDFINRMKELEISKEMVISNVQIVDEAQIPSIPIKPKPTQDVLKALIASLILGVGLCYFLEYSDSTLKTSEDVEFYTKMPFLGYIPSARRELKRNENKDLISSIKPYSQVAEAFRNLRVSLIFSFPEDRPLHTIMVTSSVAREGKSFVATNLAISFAQTKEDTLLIDADMRRGRLAQVFDVRTKTGLSSLLAGVCTLEQAVIATPIANLYLIAGGPATPNPAELLSSKKLFDILETAKTRFKRIVIDAPPTLGVSDTVMLGDKCDGLVFVVKTASTPLKLITEVRKILGKKVKIIGAVLNNVTLETDHYYSYYHYYHYTPKKT
ncbi:MAG: polysaccharide biosynthesis tyrosine autokinase, partial [Candidatus Omnitrophica bacterium]|nr:polysaccharide biosynthesis tyrosine autokinase [Candidatus Omnitrophota bacterium]